MGRVVASLRDRFDVSPATTLVAVGDLGAIAAFVLLGAVGAHGRPLGNVAGLAEAALPFVVGWVLASFLGSLYTTDARRSVVRAVSWTIPAWITAAVIAQLLRASPLLSDSFSWTLLAVSIVAGSALLVPWRAATAYWLSGGQLD